MSGRAGRRGKDDRGIVIQMLDEKMEPAVCKDILYGAPDPLNSSYRISYNMLLNLMRVEDVHPEFLIRASFHQFQREKEAPRLIAEADEMQSQAESLDKLSGEEVELAKEYYQMDQQLLLTRQRISKIVCRPKHVLRFLSPGRLLDIRIEGEDYGWGALVSCKKKPGTDTAGDAGRLASLAGGSGYTLDVSLNCVDRHFDDDDGKGNEEDAEYAGLLWSGTNRNCRPAREDDAAKVVSMRVFTVELDNIERLSAVKLVIPQDHTTPGSRRKIASSILEVKRRLDGVIPVLNPISDLGIKDEELSTLLNRAETLTERLASHRLSVAYEEEDRLILLRAYEKKRDLLEQSKAVREEARSFQKLAMKEDLKKMKKVLKKLGHVDANGVIQTKGRTACEVNTADELVVVELIFTGVFNDLSVEQSVALLSCMTFDERNKDEHDPTQGMRSFLSGPFFKLQEVARTVARIEMACGIDVTEDEFVDKFNPGMLSTAAEVSFQTSTQRPFCNDLYIFCCFC